MRKIKKPNKDILIDLYVNKRLTSYEIADIYNVHRRSVVRWLDFYGIDVNPKQRKFEHIKKVAITQQQKEFIVGTLLGDGHVGLHGRKNKTARIHISHCEAQRQLVMWKKTILGNLVNVVNRKVDKRDGTISFGFVSVVHKDFNFYRKLFYDDNLKVIRNELIHHITPLSLAVWFMDDGSRSTTNIRFHTEGFTKQENECLRDILRINFGLKSKVGTFTRNGKEYHYLSLNKANSLKLSKIVEPYVIECMRYKLLLEPDSSTTECQSPEMGDDTV